jgi:hypothetical protein
MDNRERFFLWFEKYKLPGEGGVDEAFMAKHGYEPYFTPAGDVPAWLKVTPDCPWEVWITDADINFGQADFRFARDFSCHADQQRGSHLSERPARYHTPHPPRVSRSGIGRNTHEQLKAPAMAYRKAVKMAAHLRLDHQNRHASYRLVRRPRFPDRGHCRARSHGAGLDLQLLPGKR